MKCERASRLLHRFADGELGLFSRWRVDRHLARCSACAGQLAALQNLRAGVRAKLPYHRAPPALAARIGAALPREAPPASGAWRWRLGDGLRLGGAGLAGALAGVALTMLVTASPRGSVTPDIEADLIDSHIRSMMGEHLTDVRTSDQHTVKPWLSARAERLAPGSGSRVRGFSADRRPSRLCRGPPGGGGRLPSPPARHQSIRLVVDRPGPADPHRDAAGLQRGLLAAR